MIHESLLDCIGNTPVLDLRRMFPAEDVRVLAKLELLNPGGSVKDRPARFIVENGLRSGLFVPGVSHLVESTSGNFGIGLAMVAALSGLTFTAVVDPCVTPTNLALLRCYGARVEMVHERDGGGGYLQTRLRRVAELVESGPEMVWVNQYANGLAWQSHYEETGAEFVAQVSGPVDTLVMAVSTTGTIGGVAAAVRERHPHVRVVAVDAVGSVIFGGRPGPRRIPGLGASRIPELLDRSLIDEVVHVDEAESAAGCRELLRREGILAGGSSGAVMAAIGKLLAGPRPPRNVLTLLPDRGERYLDVIDFGSGARPAAAMSPLFVSGAA